MAMATGVDGMDASLDTLKSAISTIVSLHASQEERRQAHELLASFKESSPWCASCGLALYISLDNDPTIRHIGLQLIEEYVKLHWNHLSTEEKEKLKSQAMQLIVDANFQTPGHIKEALARLLVELVKREWPQNWENLFLDLGHTQAIGEAQLELVLLILLRLAEDVVDVLDSNLQTQRRRDMIQSLNANMEHLFQFFVTTLRTQVGLWKENDSDVSERLVEATLFTLTGYLDWVNLDHVFAENAILLQMLCVLLEDSKLRLPACECLVILLERKGKTEPRAPFLVLFSEDAMNVFVESARKACLAGSDEADYRFLKKICQALVNLGINQLALLWGDARGIKTAPHNFDRYLKVILDFTNHPSQVLCLEALSVWVAFLKHEHISKDDTLIQAIPHLLASLLPKLVKVGNPDKDNHPSCEYSSMDFDSQDEFNQHFGRLRCSISNLIRECTLVLPVEAFEQNYKYILERIQAKEIENAQQGSGGDDALFSVDFLQWDALTCFTEAVMSKFFKLEEVAKGQKVVQQLGKSIDIISGSNEIIKMLIGYKTESQPIMIRVLSCIQAMFPSLKLSQEQLFSIIEKILFIFKDYRLSQPFNKETQQLRRHATGCFLHLCKEQPELLVQHFDNFETYISTLMKDEVINSTEKTNLTEGLLLVSNVLPENNRRDRFYRELLSEVSDTLSDERVKSALEDSEKFITYLGMDKAPSSDESLIKDRRKLITSANLILGVVRRCRLPTEEQTEAKGNGFFGNVTYFEHPWIPYVNALLPSLFQILRQLSLIWSPSLRSKISNGYLPALELHESEKHSLLGQHTASSAKDDDLSEESDTAVNKTRFHLFALHESCYQTLGYCGPSLGETFYRSEKITELITNHVTSTWKHLPKFRLRTVYRTFLKTFAQHCPWKYYDSVLGPVLGNVIDFMLQYLSEEWKKLYRLQSESKSAKTSKEDSEDTESQEVLEERMMHFLSREHIEFIVNICFYKKKSTEKSQQGEGQGTGNESPDAELGDIGKFLLSFEGTNKAVVFTLFAALTWPDTASVNKVTKLIPLVVEQLFNLQTEVKVPESIVEHLYLQVLKGMQCHGSDAAAQGGLLTIALHMYTTLRMNYPTLVNILMMIPSCEKEKLMKFDLDVFGGENKQLTDKKKREIFKKLLADAVGKNVSELYKSDIKIKDLPPLAPRRKPKPPQTETTENVESICDLFGDNS